MANNIRTSSSVPATLISVLSAMIGGTAGGLMGAYTGHTIPGMITGLCLGFVASIPFNIVLLTIVHSLSVFLNADFDGTPIGCHSNTVLSAVMGGAGGMLSAPVLVFTAHHFEKVDLYTLSVGCMVSILVPVVIGVGLARRANNSWVKQA